MPDPTVTPDIYSDAASYFNNGANYSAGTYRITYQSGAYKINTNSPNWGVQYDDNDVQIGNLHGFYITDGAGNVVFGPGNRTGYRTQALAEAGNSGLYVDYQHVGGKIGLYLNDGRYDDNVNGTTNPTFSLSALPVITFTATPTNGPCGVYTLAWSVGPDSTLITSVSIDQGIGSVAASGSTSVTVLSGSQTWTLTATSTAGTVTAQVTVSKATHTGGSGSDKVTPSITSLAASLFSSGDNLPAGRYYVEYVQGALRGGVDPAVFLWSVNFRDSIFAPPQSGYHITDGPTDGSGNDVYTTNPGPIGSPNPGAWGYVDQATCEAANTGYSTPYCHVGGKPIGVYYYDISYIDNTAGSPNPTWRLVGPSPSASLGASSTSVVRGASVTLSWSAIGTSASIDNGVGSLFSTASNTSGTATVNPTSTTTYTLTASADGFTDATASVTVTVLPPTVDSFTATPSTVCIGSSSTLTWTTTGAASVSIDNGIGSVSTSGSTSVSPSTTTTYTITATNTSGTATATMTVTVNALAPTPTFSLTAKGTRIIVGWTVPTGSYGTVTVNIYRGTTAGSETLLVSGLAVATGSYTNSGLMSGTQYFYRVSFTNDCGEGTLAAEQSATATCCQGEWTPSTAPTNTFTPSPVPASTASAPSVPASTFRASTPPTTTWTASTPPDDTYVPEDCPG